MGLLGTFFITIHGLIRLSLYINVMGAGLKSERHGIVVKRLLKKCVSAVFLAKVPSLKLKDRREEPLEIPNGKRRFRMKPSENSKCC